MNIKISSEYNRDASDLWELLEIESDRLTKSLNLTLFKLGLRENVLTDVR